MGYEAGEEYFCFGEAERDGKGEASEGEGEGIEDIDSILPAWGEICVGEDSGGGGSENQTIPEEEEDHG